MNDLATMTLSWIVLIFMCFLGGAFYSVSFDISMWAPQVREHVLLFGVFSLVVAGFAPLFKD